MFAGTYAIKGTVSNPSCISEAEAAQQHFPLPSIARACGPMLHESIGQKWHSYRRSFGGLPLSLAIWTVQVIRRWRVCLQS